MIVDSHCHLDMIAERDDLDAVVARAREAGVATMLTISTKLSNVDRIRGIAAHYDDVWAAVGVHPHEAGNEGQTAPDAVIAAAQHPRVIAIGESGLDYHYHFASKAAQRANFRAHIQAAQQTGLPLVVHAREADEEVAEILREEHANGGPFGCIMHCFSSGRDLAMAALDLGFHISFSGIVTFKKSQALRDIAKEVPDDKLLIETDAPYLAPQPKRGKPNEPSYVRYTCEHLADTLGTAPEELAARTTANFFALFDRAERPAAAVA
jgi:TatD DNase family protein